MTPKFKQWYLAFLGFGIASALFISVLAANRPSDLVEVTSVNPNIVISLPYATKDNFCDQVLYPVERCFLRRSVVERLDKVQKDLEKDGYGLKVWDGYRPRSVQYKMWAIKPGTHYVANPRRGSRHNRGAAVDLTLIDFKTKEELKMPTGYDVFNLKAHAYYDKLPREILENRKRLQKAMTSHGFQVMRSEWWHFDARGWTEFPLLNIGIDELAKKADALKEVVEPQVKEAE